MHMYPCCCLSHQLSSSSFTRMFLYLARYASYTVPLSVINHRLLLKICHRLHLRHQPYFIFHSVCLRTTRKMSMLWCYGWQSLSLPCNNITDSGCGDIAQALEYNSTLGHLNLRCNYIGITFKEHTRPTTRDRNLSRERAWFLERDVIDNFLRAQPFDHSVQL